MQYKFRGKRKDNGEWVYGLLVMGVFNDTMIQVKENGFYSAVVVIPETVGMWTGMKDKNGVKIYDGDILKSFSPSVPAYEVFYDRSSYRLRYKLKCGEWYDWGPLFRMEEIQWEGRLPICPDVIGNIHEHPHLLNPAKGAVTNTMNTDPNNAQAAPANQEQATTNDGAGVTSQEVAEQEAQEQAMESAEEGATEG